jgi:hypothetical protein
MYILLGIIFMLAGIWIVLSSGNLTDAFGRRSRADRNLWGTTQAFVLMGFIIILFGALTMFGWKKVFSSPVQTISTFK